MTWKTLFAAVLVVGAAACTSRQADVAPAADTTATVAAATAPTQNADVAFVDSMVPHHRMAVQMADMVIRSGRSADVKAMARKMRDAQTAEIAEMQRIRAELAGADTTAAAADSAGMHHHGMMMANMPMQAAMDSMKTMQGQMLDRMFLQHMIPHHQQAIGMVQRFQPGLTHAGLQQLARKMMEDQQREVAEMQRMLAALPAH